MYVSLPSIGALRRRVVLRRKLTPKARLALASGTCVFVAFPISRHADALTINLTYDSTVTSRSEYTNGSLTTAMSYAVGQFTSLYNDNITVAITVAASSSGLGQSNSSLVKVS